MARLILGQRPLVEAKTYSRGYSEILITESRGDIEEEISRAAQHAGVPAEATLTRVTDRRTDVVVFTWRWWEVVI